MASLIIFYAPEHNRRSELLISGVDLDEAKRFSRNPTTSNMSEGWFVGFTDTDDTGLPNRTGEDTSVRDRLLDLWFSRRAL